MASTEQSQKLEPTPLTMPFLTGPGPRHIVCHQSRGLAYLVYELANAVQTFRIGHGGVLTAVGPAVSSLPADFQWGKAHTTAHIELHSSGNFL